MVTIFSGVTAGQCALAALGVGLLAFSCLVGAVCLALGRATDDGAEAGDRP